ncbi:DUF493 family protein [Seonamhaeicola marinus]|uniref:DUF493 domain-containing protein n=1 Tax=Seonamhaeicola marinus TaxID=1912246 RepID=A0A5D0I654_9FLAO|nr:DUF493 family protein [Seonamhaeicola marinus]TYA78389.1 DUF493 domain-containing protein [Seonamhaeicola marinus]
MNSSSKSEEFYDKLRGQLYETTSWPAEYLYKFIVKSDSKKIAKLEGIFDNMGAVINSVESKNGKYTSVSVNLLMRDPNQVIEKYKEVAEKIEGVISL